VTETPTEPPGKDISFVAFCVDPRFTGVIAVSSSVTGDSAQVTATEEVTVVYKAGPTVYELAPFTGLNSFQTGDGTDVTDERSPPNDQNVCGDFRYLTRFEPSGGDTIGVRGNDIQNDGQPNENAEPTTTNAGPPTNNGQNGEGGPPTVAQSGPARTTTDETEPAAVQQEEVNGQ
jgi:hypothetical protein